MILESYVKVIDVIGLFFDMLSMWFHTTRHWLTSGRLMHELDVCTVALCFNMSMLLPGYSGFLPYYYTMPKADSTVPTFDSCTKCSVSPGMIHDRTRDFEPVF